MTRIWQICMGVALVFAAMANPAQAEAAQRPHRKAHYEGESPRHLQASYQSIGGNGGLVFGGHGGYYFYDDFMAGIDLGYLYQFDRFRDDYLVVEPLARYLLVNRHFLALSVTAKVGRYFNLGADESGTSVGAGPAIEAYWGRRGHLAVSVLYKRIIFPNRSVPAYEVGAGLGF